MIIISELPYSLHLGSNKNRKNSVRSSAKNNISGTTSMTNNGIQNAKTLSKCDKHNYRKYDNEQEQIVIVKGTSFLYKDVEDFYKNEVEEARLEYNNKQTRDDRKIDDYFKKVSENSKSDLACEIIIELGDKKFWDTKDLNCKHKMTNVYSKQIDEYRKDNFNLKFQLQELQQLFEKLINFLKRMFHRKDKENIYAEVFGDLYDNKNISEKTFDRITGWDNEKGKEKDDFEL